ncbi:MAG TPA: ATP-binding protein [Roseiflexaceae bacterium]|nr:ATP-binding protein [Roseiflexaceae bacterium]
MLDDVPLLQASAPRQHRDAIVQDWMAALASIGVAPLRPAEVRDQLRRLTDQILALLSHDSLGPVELQQAQRVGMQLAALAPGQPEVLARTHEVLGRALLRPGRAAATLAPRLVALLGHVATGYLHHTTAAILEEQERARMALDSARERAMTALRERQAQLELVLKHLPVILMTIDAQGTILFADGHGFDLIHTDPSAVSGVSIFDLYIDFPDLRSYLQRAIDGEVSTHMVVRHGHTYELWFVPIRSVSVRLLLMALDVTDRVRADEERLGLERAIQAGQRQAQAGLMASGVIHDFQNLLAVILGNATLLRLDLSDDGKRKDELVRIEQAASQATTLVKQLLAYTRPAQERTDLVDLNTVIGEMMPLLRTLMPDRVRLDSSLASDLAPVVGDTTQMRQVVMNLVINASEAIGETSGAVTITTSVQQIDGAPVVQCEVSDTGCGMDAETLRRIFDPFFSTKKSGHGLGLAALQSIVQQHQGRVLVHSAVGEGTTFTVQLPCADHKRDARL